MMPRANRRSVRLSAKLALAATAAAPLLTVLTPAPAQAAAGGTSCSAASSPAEAIRLTRDLNGVLSRRHGVISVAFTDLGTGVTCQVNSGRRFDSASVIKATILATLLYQEQAENRWLSARDRALATAMITRSDNSAASALWYEVGGHGGVQRFLNAAGLHQTTAGYGSSWGLSQITAADELKLLNLLVGGRILGARSRAYELGLMRGVVGWQRWGVPTGVASGESAANKNGWLPRATYGWRVHSIGAVTGRHTYLVAILTEGNASMGYGVSSVSAIAATINHDVG